MAVKEVKSRRFIYKNSIKWQSEKRGLLSSFDKPDIEFATPPEFKGHVGIWSPEDLFVASVNTCIMSTFFYYAQRENLEILSYESQAQGILERRENQSTPPLRAEAGFIFTEIKLRPFILIKEDSDILKTKNLLELSEKRCLISNSIKSKVEVTPEIRTKAENNPDARNKICS